MIRKTSNAFEGDDYNKGDTTNLFIKKQNSEEKEENIRKFAQKNLSFEIMSNLNAMSITGLSKDNMATTGD